MRIPISILVSFLLLIVGNAFADIRECRNCTAAQYRSTALVMGSGSHYVYDLMNGSMHKFSVECVTNQAVNSNTSRTTPTPAVPLTLATCRGNLIADETVVEADMQDAFNHLHAFYLETYGTLRANAQATWNDNDTAHTGIDSGFQIAGSTNVQTVAGYWLNDHAGFSATVAWVLAHLDKFQGWLPTLTITVQVAFPDGTKSEFTFTNGQNHFVYTPNSTTMEGPNGTREIVPDKSPTNNYQHLSGEQWIFGPTGTSGQSFVDHLRNLGIPITTGGGGRITSITFTWDGTKLVATVRRGV